MRFNLFVYITNKVIYIIVTGVNARFMFFFKYSVVIVFTYILWFILLINDLTDLRLYNLSVNWLVDQPISQLFIRSITRINTCFIECD